MPGRHRVRAEHNQQSEENWIQPQRKEVNCEKKEEKRTQFKAELYFLLHSHFVSHLKLLRGGIRCFLIPDQTCMTWSLSFNHWTGAVSLTLNFLLGGIYGSLTRFIFGVGSFVVFFLPMPRVIQQSMFLFSLETLVQLSSQFAGR